MIGHLSSLSKVGQKGISPSHNGAEPSSATQSFRSHLHTASDRGFGNSQQLIGGYWRTQKKKDEASWPKASIKSCELRLQSCRQCVLNRPPFFRFFIYLPREGRIEKCAAIKRSFIYMKNTPITKLDTPRINMCKIKRSESSHKQKISSLI